MCETKIRYLRRPRKHSSSPDIKNNVFDAMHGKEDVTHTQEESCEGSVFEMKNLVKGPLTELRFTSRLTPDISFII